MTYASTGTGLSDGTMSGTAHISTEQLEAYNSALMGMSTYLPYGSVQVELENLAAQELELMDGAIDTFTEVVIDMVQVVEVAEMAEEASTPAEESAVQEFVATNSEVLTIDQEEVDTYNQSLDDIEIHANNASAFLAVAGNGEAVAFLDQGVENANTTADQTNIFYNANSQWIAMGYPTTRNLTAVYLNGQNFGLDLYVTEADILSVGSESDFYLTGPTALGYKCFMTQEDCE
jgi:predicted GNAT family acetyltransferase